MAAMYEVPAEGGADRMEEVAFHALAGKYSVDSGRLRERTIRPLLERLRLMPTAKLGRVCKEIRGEEDDVRNQLATLLLIDRDWAGRPSAELDLETLHRMLYGCEFSELRSTEFVADFEGIPPTELSDLQDSVKAINRSLRGIDALRSEPLDGKLAYLAWLLSSTIGSHAFADGNGRVARMAVQYCLRRWGMDFVPLPKVRNAEGWKRALHAAIGGDLTDLSAYLGRLVANQTIESVEQFLSASTKEDAPLRY